MVILAQFSNSVRMQNTFCYNIELHVVSCQFNNIQKKKKHFQTFDSFVFKCWEWNVYWAIVILMVGAMFFINRLSDQCKW